MKRVLLLLCFLPEIVKRETLKTIKFSPKRQKVGRKTKNYALCTMNYELFVVPLHPHLRNSVDERCCSTNKFNT